MRNRFSGIIRRALILALPAAFLVCSGCHPAPTAGDAPVRIGAPQGAGGLLAAYAAEKTQVRMEVTPEIDVSKIQDCCSSYAQWALSSRSVDAAVICVDAARALVEKDRRYTIIGPCLCNSDLVVVKDPQKVRTVGIAQNRRYQEEIVTRTWGQQVRVKPMLATALAYAYEQGAVDGIVIDLEEGLRLSGSRIAVTVNGGECITYMLVAAGDFQARPGFQPFLSAFGKSALELNDPVTLQQAIAKFSAYSVSGKEAEQWIQTGIRFMAP
jgi:hypothetical protein